jgi:hypothetical protein
MGEATVLVAEVQGRVLGSLAITLRRLLLPSGEERAVAYLADLKVDQEARTGFVLRRLMAAAAEIVRPAGAAVAVVMEGTRVTPIEYTGRVGIPTFEVLGRIAVLRLSTSQQPQAPEPVPGNGASLFRHLSRGRYAPIGGQPQERSQIDARWLIDPFGRACGLLEDTRRGKRLIADDGSELISAHLSCFAYHQAEDGARLLRRALAEAGHGGFPALFVAVPEDEAGDLLSCLNLGDVVVAPAVVYGVGLPPGIWNINTSEI